MYSLTLLDDNLINRFDEDPSFSLQNSSPLTSSKRKQQYDGGLSDFLQRKNLKWKLMAKLYKLWCDGRGGRGQGGVRAS